MSAPLIAAAVIAIIGGLISLVAHANSRLKRSRVQEALMVRAHARLRGWDVETPAEGVVRYRLRGKSPGGLAWTLVFDLGTHTGPWEMRSSPKLAWRTETLKAARTEFMISGREQWAALGGPAMKLLSASARVLAKKIYPALAKMSGFVEDATVSSYGSPAFRERFVLAARPPAMASAVPARLEDLLLRWPPQAGRRFDPGRDVSIWFDAGELHVDCRFISPSAPVLDHIVAIGSTLADALRNLPVPKGPP